MKIRAIIIMAAVLIALGVVFFLTNRPEPEPRPEPRTYVWSFEMTDLAAITISLTEEQKSESWIKREDKQWYFDRPAVAARASRSSGSA